jgi:Na+/proline symporter
MAGQLNLQPIDALIIGSYLLLALMVGMWVTRDAGTGVRSYFLANRALPWWWAGISIAATTFAADTPLAVAGIVASKGISGNWIWLAWMGVHAAVVVLFAESWSRSGVVTDAELIARRYSGRPASLLRTARAGLFGLLYNAIILGWVLRAMVKIAAPFFHWETWTPWLVSSFALFWPAQSSMGSPSEAITVVMLLGLVVLYTSLGGLRGVIVTDLVQLGLALFGSIWFAWRAWEAVGGRSGLTEGLTRLYGADNGLMDLFPHSPPGALGASALGFLLFGLYLVVQSYANVPADGGGYLMQRLNATRSPRDARRASMLFLLLQYPLRVWPWLVVGLAALVLIPIGGEASALSGAGATVAGDRESAYPVLMGALLRPGVLGVLVVSLLAAFMSTVDTHMNWGASYFVNDIYLRLRPKADDRSQIRVARLAVVVFAVIAVLVSLQIDTIEQAWKWVAALGAALGAPTALRWVWWRVNAVGELAAMAAGLTTAAVLLWVPLAFEQALLVIASASLLGLGLGIRFGPATDPRVIDAFQRDVHPSGFWPGRSARTALAQLAKAVLRWCAVIGGTVALLAAVQHALLLGKPVSGVLWFVAGIAALAWGGRGGTGTRTPGLAATAGEC